MKKWGKIAALCLTGVVSAICAGCEKDVSYGQVYDYETDCQYSYVNSVHSWKKVQSDGDGQYILENQFIYYYSAETNEMTPLCNKANCLHDMETDQERMEDCNAYAPTDMWGGMKYIQYYDGAVYYVVNDSLYRLGKDGSRKDKIFTIADDMRIDNWLIHRGYFYYDTKIYYYGEDETTQIYNKYTLKAVALSSHMREKKAKVIFESDEEHSGLTFGQLRAYQNYLYYHIVANGNDFNMTDEASWVQQLDQKSYLYNIETGENRVIPVPEGYSETTVITGSVFLKDNLLLQLYDDLQEEEYKFPIYSVNYDLTDEKIWLDGVEQDKFAQSYENYVIISDADIQYFVKNNQKSCNIEIYSADAKLLSWFTYPRNVMGNFNGFGPDGRNVEFAENEDSWSLYELNFEDVLNCRGETVQPQLVSERKYGTFMRE